MADKDEAQDFKRRARRRLIGAIALVLFLVIVPPWIMEREPKPSVSGLNVEIPSQDAKRPPPKVAPPVAAKPEDKPPAPAEKMAKADEPVAAPPAPEAPRAAAEPSRTEPKPAAEAAGKSERPVEKPVKPAPKEVPRKSDAERAEALLAGAPPMSYVVPVGTYANGEGVKQVQAKLAGAGIKSYTEAAGNGQTRVRAGPFASREAAEKARERLAGAGLKPGAVVARK